MYRQGADAVRVFSIPIFPYLNTTIEAVSKKIIFALSESLIQVESHEKNSENIDFSL